MSLVIYTWMVCFFYQISRKLSKAHCRWVHCHHNLLQTTVQKNISTIALIYTLTTRQLLSKSVIMICNNELKTQIVSLDSTFILCALLYTLRCLYAHALHVLLGNSLPQHLHIVFVCFLKQIPWLSLYDVNHINSVEKLT